MASIIKPKKGYENEHRLSRGLEKSEIFTELHTPDPPETMSRLPIYHDDLSFHDRNRRAFDDMRRRMESDMHSPFTRSWDDEFDRMCGDFYHLRPTADPLSRMKRPEGGYGSRERQDDGSMKSVIVEDPVTKNRRFEMSFDLKDYDSKNINLKMHDDTLVVEAKQEVDKDGTKTSSQFSRKIQIPTEVDASRLSSTLSKDGILTVTAPVPPQYNTIAPPPQESAQYSPRSPKKQAFPEPPLLVGRSSPINQGRSSPMFTQRVDLTPGAPTQMSASSRSPVPAPPSYEQCRNGTTSPVKVIQTRPTPPLEEPTFYNTEKGREFVLLVEIGKPYTPDDIKVKVDGLTITVEAEHVEIKGTKSSKSSTVRNFDIKYDLDPETVTANLKGGVLEIHAVAK